MKDKMTIDEIRELNIECAKAMGWHYPEDWSPSEYALRNGTANLKPVPDYIIDVNQRLPMLAALSPEQRDHLRMALVDSYHAMSPIPEITCLSDYLLHLDQPTFAKAWLKVKNGE